MTAVVACGAACVTAAAVALPFDRLDLKFAILVCLTIGLGSRITVPIPSLKSHVSVSDTFIFLTLLLYGGEAAVLLATVEALFSSWRFCNKKITVLFNCAAMASSTNVVYGVLAISGLYTENHLHGSGDHFGNFVIVLSLAVLTQFIVNTALASIYDSIKNGISLWVTWKRKYLWTFVSYFIGAIGAGVLVQLSDLIGFVAILVSVPLILFVFLTYRMYLRNVEISMSQAEQAERYAMVLKEQAGALQESEERFRTAFDHAPIGIAMVSPEGRWLRVNRALCSILGYREEELLNQEIGAVLSVEDLPEIRSKLIDVKEGRAESLQGESRFLNKIGRTVWASWSASSVRDTKTETRSLIFQVQNITDKKVAEQRLQYDATHDALTGLANRSLLMCRLGEALAKSRAAQNYLVSMLFIDLDRFKNINDSLGHIYGDRLLINIAERLRGCLRPTDMIARIGGDEFVVLVEGHIGNDEVIAIADRILQQFSIPFDLGDHAIYSSASIGVLHASERHLSGEDMMRDADTAMYHAKRAGKARHEVFDDKMHAAAKETLKLETYLRWAIENDEFTVRYQPIYSLNTGSIQGCEALARWIDKELGEVPPSRFIAMAEEIGLIDALGESIIRKACLEFKTLPTELADKLSLSVNLSCKQFANPNLVESIKRILVETSFSPVDLKLEITESVFFEYQERALRMLNQLRELGIEFNVDDFGTGYSNLAYLTALPISSLKIDRSFVAMFDEKGGNPAIVQTIVMLARNLGLRVVAEGVESESQLAQLRKLNCDYAQGFLLAAPMDINRLKDFLEESVPQSVERFENYSLVSTIQ